MKKTIAIGFVVAAVALFVGYSVHYQRKMQVGPVTAVRRAVREILPRAVHGSTVEFTIQLTERWTSGPAADKDSHFIRTVVGRTILARRADGSFARHYSYFGRSVQGVPGKIYGDD